MQITHNEFTAGLWLVVALSSGIAGWMFASFRFRRQPDDAYDDGYDRGWDDAYAKVIEEDRQRARAGDDLFDAMVRIPRHTVLLEPGPTIYPELAALSQEPVRGPERPAKASESTWYRTTWLDLERRYPIHQDSPTGTMTEAL